MEKKSIAGVTGISLFAAGVGMYLDYKFHVVSRMLGLCKKKDNKVEEIVEEVDEAAKDVVENVKEAAEKVAEQV